jgi:mono/diheme cytochrome c family protein
VNKTTQLSSFIFLILFLFEAENTSASINVQVGQSLYFEYCTPCHQVDTKLIGPALRDADKRRPDDWLNQWIRNNQALRAAGDKDALALYNGYNVEMPAFTSFSDDQIRSIMAYVDSRPADIPSAVSNTTSQSQFYLLYVLIGFFLIITIILLRTNFLLVHHLQEIIHETKIKAS